MRIPDYIATAQTNLLRTKLRTFLTVFAFVIGTFTLAMTTAFSQGLRSYLNTQLAAYGQPNVVTVSVGSKATQSSSSGVPYYDPTRQASQASGGGGPHDGKVVSFTLNQQDLAKVKAVAHVKAAYPEYSNLTIDYIQYGSSPKYVLQAQSAFPGQSQTLAAGQFPSNAQANGIVLPYTYVEALGVQNASDLIGKSVTLHLTGSGQQGKDYTATVTGILPDTAHVPQALLAYQTVNDMVQFQSGSTNQFTDILAITDDNPTTATRTQIKNTLQGENYNAQTYDDELASFSRPLSIVTYGLDGFAAIALLAATIGIVNTLLMSVLERTQEIGLLKALGMRRRGITFIYLVEAASIGFWGGVAGVLFGRLLGFGLNPILNRTLFKGIGNAHVLSYPLSYMAMIVGGAMVIGLLAGTLPAIRAGKLDPIDALRRE
jgi:putative ABC transport system permease protein